MQQSGQGSEKNYLPMIRNKNQKLRKKNHKKTTSTKGLPNLASKIIKDVNKSIQTTFRSLQKIEHPIAAKKLVNIQKVPHESQRKKKYSQKIKTELTEDDHHYQIQESIEEEAGNTMTSFEKQILSQKNYIRQKSKENKKKNNEKLDQEKQKKNAFMKNFNMLFQTRNNKGQKKKDHSESFAFKRVAQEKDPFNQSEEEILPSWNKHRMNSRFLDTSLQEEIDRLAVYEKRNQNCLETYLKSRKQLLAYSISKNK